MKFDTIVIGGGLSGLVSAIECARAGQKTAVVSAGQSALHFWSGSFEFLCQANGREVVENPLKEAESLPPEHPYRKIGSARLGALLERVKPLLAEAGIKVNGSLERNHYRMTPLGFFKPAWLTLDDYVNLGNPDRLPWKKVALVNILSYIDFYPRFLAYGLEKRGAECTISTVNIPQLDILRRSTTEMRATNMARFLHNDAIGLLARRVCEASRGADAVIMPAIFGMFSEEPVKAFRSIVDVPVYFVPTTPASVPGVRCQLSLRDRFIDLGGTFMPGDTVTGGMIEKGRLHEIRTANLGDMPLEADNFVISTGSFFGHGLIATMDRVYEPIFNLDLNISGGRTEWYDKNFYAPQPYMDFGVDTDERFQPSHKGKRVENLYATGALLNGFNALKEGSGAGVTLATALSAADYILKGGA